MSSAHRASGDPLTPRRGALDRAEWERLWQDHWVTPSLGRHRTGVPHRESLSRADQERLARVASEFERGFDQMHDGQSVSREIHRLRSFLRAEVMLVEYSSAFVSLPGGFGILDEMFEAATLIQCRKIRPFPLILLGESYWEGLREFIWHLHDSGAISREDISPREAVEVILDRIPSAIRAQLVERSV